MTKQQEIKLMDQIVALYKVWAGQQLDTEYGQRLINGLFNVAKEIDAERMMAAFQDGTAERR